MLPECARKQSTKEPNGPSLSGWMIALSLSVVVFALSGCSVSHSKTEKGEEVTIKTPVGGMNVNENVDPSQIGLTVYPGSRPHHDNDNDSGAVNMDMFGMKLVVASFDTDDAPEQVANFYSKEIKKYGNVLQCKSNGMRFSPHRNSGEEWGCEHGEATDIKAAASDGGLELKAGSKNNMHVVGIEPSGKGTKYALVYIRTGRGETI